MVGFCCFAFSLAPGICLELVVEVVWVWVCVYVCVCICVCEHVCMCMCKKTKVGAGESIPQGSFFVKVLFSRCCLWGPLDTQGESLSCWNFNIFSAPVFIPFWNATNSLVRKFAGVCAAWLVILVETKKLVWQKEGRCILSFPLPVMLSCRWRSNTEGHPYREALREGSAPGKNMAARTGSDCSQKTDTTIFLKKKVVTPGNSWVP